MSTASAPGPELLRADDYQQYLLHEKREIAFVLRQLAAKHANVTAYFGDSTRILPTSVIALTEGDRSIIVDLSIDKDLNAAAIRAGRLLCITALDKIRIQFPLEDIEQIEYNGQPALQAPLPDLLLRLQRREHYRLAVSLNNAPACRIVIDAATSEQIEARVLDISGGGMALQLPTTASMFSFDAEFTDCRIDLPDHGIITTRLRVRNVMRVHQPNGTETLRVGCQFLALATPESNAIQRYILRVERDRKARGLID
ncbi:flagellar brake protein [Uliginosibacterium sp. sgz301328]|uniref:flagellar brake protein n=1 Tax=Uliginosibacterium sp. sgz301328 TaxID=3243764 RepID=UPI00359E8ACD